MNELMRGSSCASMPSAPGGKSKHVKIRPSPAWLSERSVNELPLVGLQTLSTASQSGRIPRMSLWTNAEVAPLATLSATVSPYTVVGQLPSGSWPMLGAANAMANSICWPTNGSSGDTPDPLTTVTVIFGVTWSLSDELEPQA